MQNFSSCQTFIAGETLEAFRRVKLTSDKVVYADATEAAIGVTQETGVLDREVAVRLLNDAGSFAIEVDEAVAAFATLYASADGFVSGTDAGTAVVSGIAKEASSASGDIIEVLPIESIAV